MKASTCKSEPPAVAAGNPGRPLRVGFLPESDCAPLIVAQEFGVFEHYGLSVQLQCQPSWKHIHDKIIHGYLDAAQAPATLPFLINLGLTEEKATCFSGVVLSLQGAAITISRELSRLGVSDAASLREQLWKDRNRKIYTFGVSGPLSIEHALLHQWLRSAAAPPFVDVRIEPVPPEQMFPLLKLGYLDGCCVGEPWTSVAVQAGVGVCVATSATLAPSHPGKVLMVLKSFAQERAEAHERLAAALLHACAMCEELSTRQAACELLARPHLVNAPVECVEPGLVGPFAPKDARLRASQGLHVFCGSQANEPTPAKADWIAGQLFDLLRWNNRPASLNRAFRPEVYRRAQRLLQPLGKLSPR